MKGDTTDNIPGIPGIGEKTASQLIQQFGSIENILAHLDEVKPAKAQQALSEHAEQARMSKEAEDKALQELRRLESMPPMSAEATVSRNYLDWLIAVPWSKRTKERKDLVAAEKILNDDHYGLEKVKERIVEFLAKPSQR